MKIEQLIGKIEEYRQGKDIEFHVVYNDIDGNGGGLITLDKEDLNYLYTKYSDSAEELDLRNDLKEVLKKLNKYKDEYKNNNFKPLSEE